jgi:hypothetical protein
MSKGSAFEDVHAPVEDVDVSFNLKLLVVFMVLLLGGLTFVLVLLANRAEVFDAMMQAPL